jgi:multiple sugar transport system substrate-binding protein
MTQLSRRTVVKGMAAAGAVAAFPAIAACGDSGDDKASSSSSGSGGKKEVGTVTLGSNQSDPIPKKAVADTMAAFETQSGGTVKINTVDHNTFQEQINSYLQGRPDDVFLWFAGYRMQFFAQRGLAHDISDVWKDIGSNFSEGTKQAATGLDGKQYLVPFDYYPWAIFYRKSVFEKNGYEIPKTLDELNALGKQMQGDGLDPIAFGDKDGWPAMGTFDILNLRINGYDFHMQLMKGEASWEDPKVAKVFDTWKGILPIHQGGSLGRTWQEAAQSVANKKSGMYLLGLFVGQQFTGDAHDDLDFFPFPEVDSAVGMDTLDAPIDGFMLSKDPKNLDGANELLKFVSTGKAQNLYLKSDPNFISPAKDADTSAYTPLQKKAAELVSSAKSFSQFLDRDTRPDFASTVMIPALQSFIKDPNDAASILKKTEQQKKTIFQS